MKLNKTYKKLYLKNPTRCPFCKGEMVAFPGTTFGGKNDAEMRQVSRCENCHAVLIDIYRLVNVEDG